MILMIIDDDDDDDDTDDDDVDHDVGDELHQASLFGLPPPATTFSLLITSK